MATFYDPFWPCTTAFDFWIRFYVESAIRMGL